MAEIKITADNFEKEVLNSELPVIIDFWATWCGPCMMMAPVVEELANELEGKVKVGKVNVDEEYSLAMQFKINAIPTIIYFKNGKETGRATGFRQKEELLDWIK